MRTGSTRAMALALAALAACSQAPPEPVRDRPNVLWIVWDTVRADRLSLYGYARPTTPRLERWAADARVFEDCSSTSCWTVPSHASMFTGLLPSEHGATNARRWLDEGHETIAELFRGAGYRTFLWSANPHVAALENFHQGFDVEAHPWDPELRERAAAIVWRKLTGREGTPRRTAGADAWAVKAAGELAQERLEAWLDSGDPERPWFAFVNYMEAHRPYVPARESQERVMTPEQMQRAGALEKGWLPMWAYTFGLREARRGELEAVGALYDATLTELDDLFGRLVEALEARGVLDDTIVVLTSDHGEHLGEQHMFDHQYGLYDATLRVPLVLRYPRGVPPGRETRPVANMDVFPTLLALAGLPGPARGEGSAVSLLEPSAERVRLAEYLVPFDMPFETVRAAHPDWDPAPFDRALRALGEGRWKLVWGEDGRHELYDVRADPGETRDLAGEEPEVLARLLARLEGVLATLRTHDGGEESVPAPTREQLELLDGLGYGGR